MSGICSESLSLCFSSCEPPDQPTGVTRTPSRKPSPMPNKALQRTRISAGCFPWRFVRAAELSRYMPPQLKNILQTIALLLIANGCHTDSPISEIRVFSTDFHNVSIERDKEKIYEILVIWKSAKETSEINAPLLDKGEIYKIDFFSENSNFSSSTVTARA